MKRILLALVLVAASAAEDDAMGADAQGRVRGRGRAPGDGRGAPRALRRPLQGPRGAKHHKVTLQAFVAHHGAAQVEAYFESKRRLAPTDFKVPSDHKQPWRVQGLPGRAASFRQTFSYGHWRWAALGPVLQCPPSILTSFGTVRELIT